MKLTLFHKGLLLVAIPLCFEITFFGILLNLQNQAELEAQRVSRYKQINDGLNFILRKALILGKAPTSAFNSQVFRDNLAEIFINFDRLDKLTQGDAALHQDVKTCQQSMRAAERSLQFIQSALRSGQPYDSDAIMQARANLIQEVNDTIGDDFLDLADKTSLASDDGRSRQLRERIKLLLQFALGLSVLVGVVGAGILTQHLVKRLDRLTLNAACLARGERLPPTDRGGDEVAELDRSFHYAAELIEEATRMRREATAMITHDLKTPLQSIKSFLEMLRHGMLARLNTRGTEMLTASETDSVRMASLIDSVLQLEKLRSGNIKLNITRVKVLPVMEKSLAALQNQANDRQIEFKLEYGQAANDTVEADEFWLEQVLVNILSNAIKFSPARAAVTTAVRSTSQEVVIRISDKGPGIPKEERVLVFERFHRVMSTASNIAGSGLGLTISRELIEMHHGSIDIESEVGTGSTFNIRLPRSKEISRTGSSGEQDGKNIAG